MYQKYMLLPQAELSTQHFFAVFVTQQAWQRPWREHLERGLVSISLNCLLHKCSDRIR